MPAACHFFFPFAKLSLLYASTERQSSAPHFTSSYRWTRMNISYSNRNKNIVRVCVVCAVALCPNRRKRHFSIFHFGSHPRSVAILERFAYAFSIVIVAFVWRDKWPNVSLDYIFSLSFSHSYVVKFELRKKNTTINLNLSCASYRFGKRCCFWSENANTWWYIRTDMSTDGYFFCAEQSKIR